MTSMEYFSFHKGKKTKSFSFENFDSASPMLYKWKTLPAPTSYSLSFPLCDEESSIPLDIHYITSYKTHYFLETSMSAKGT